MRVHVEQGDDVNVIKAFLVLLVVNEFEHATVSFDKQQPHVALVGGRKARFKGEELSTLWFTFETGALASLIALTSRAVPPKHSPAVLSSAEQGPSYLLIGSNRAWKSLVCRMVRL